jgi:hypothetical protein
MDLRHFLDDVEFWWNDRVGYFKHTHHNHSFIPGSTVRRIPLKILMGSLINCVSLSLIRTNRFDTMDASPSRDIADRLKQ